MISITVGKCLHLGREIPKGPEFPVVWPYFTIKASMMVHLQREEQQQLSGDQYSPALPNVDTVQRSDALGTAEGGKGGWERGKQHFSWGQTQLFKILIFDVSSINRERRQPSLSPYLEHIACMQLADKGDGSCPVPHIPFNWGKTVTEAGGRRSNGRMSPGRGQPPAPAGPCCWRALQAAAEKLPSPCWLHFASWLGYRWGVPLFSSSVLLSVFPHHLERSWLEQKLQHILILWEQNISSLWPTWYSGVPSKHQSACVQRNGIWGATCYLLNNPCSSPAGQKTSI